MRAARCPEYGAPEVVAVETVDAPERGCRARCGSTVDAAAVNFPDVLLVGGRVPDQGAAAVRARAASSPGVVSEVGAGVERARGRRPCLRQRDGRRVRGAGRGRRRRRSPRCPAGVDAAVAAGFGVAHRTAYHVLRSVAARATRRGGHRARGRRRGGSRDRAARDACSARRSPRSRRGREARGGAGVRRDAPREPPRRRSADPAPRDRCPTVPTSSSIPVGGDAGRARVARTALGRPLRDRRATRRARSRGSR